MTQSLLTGGARAGIHGAAMTYTAYQPTRRSGMMEVVPMSAGGNYHYHNLAHWNQVQYRTVPVVSSHGQACNDTFRALLEEVARLNQPHDPKRD